MMNFLHFDVVLSEGIHLFGQIFVERKKEIHAQTIVGSIEEGLTILFASLTDFGHFFQPARTTRHHRKPHGKAFLIIGESRRRSGKFDSDVGTLKGFAVEQMLGIYIDGTNHFVTSFQGDSFNFMAHFAITNQCNFHRFRFYKKFVQS